ncbi:hypothetical protein CCC_01267 [Paramagnetospirillum magnetotacticum MS-1]|uniref:Uncharacterized protein n=2 Tax=Paramagnetospirillum magnetotacticum TaxID=188 RepID=A0A0C2UZG1_PARME|nr:hypothetical protein CCC_01267 [Paramagnetospirillum magnetotacticum MS-1]
MSYCRGVAVFAVALITGISSALAEGAVDKLDRYTTPPEPRQWKFGEDGGGGFHTKPSADKVRNTAKDCAAQIASDVVASNASGQTKDGCAPFKSLQSLWGPFLKLDAGAEANFWQPNASGIRIVDYDTTGFKGYSLSASFGLMDGAPILSASYRAPFDGTSRQRELMRAGGTSSPTGMEQFNVALEMTKHMGLAADWLFGPAKSGFGPYLFRTIGSFKPSYQFQHFFGLAQAHSNIAIIGAGATQQGNILTGGVTALNPGQAMSFRTNFESVRASVDLLAGSVPKKTDGTDASFRIGYFDTKYRRPTVNGHAGADYFVCNTCGAGWRYYLFDTTFRSRGMMLDAEFSGKGQQWSAYFGAGIDIGIDNDVRVTNSSINLYPRGISYFGSRLRAGYQYDFLGKDEIAGIFLRLDGEIASHAWVSEGSIMGRLYGDSDMNERISASLGIRF